MGNRAETIKTEFSDYLQQWSRDLDALRQNALMNESMFLAFARERGLRVSGIGKGEAGELHMRGLLAADGNRGDDLLFHPFRFFALQQVMISAENAQSANKIVDLAILLEPIYWHSIIGHLSYNVSKQQFEGMWGRYQATMLELVRRTDIETWKTAHFSMRVDAGWMDRNDELYRLLRLSLWERRKELTGSIAGAMWIRHIAEVIRRGFEEAHQIQWAEEDVAFGSWRPGARVRVFGSERPLDDSTSSKPFISRRFGLFTGSSLRWYVEGETEYFAISHILENPSRMAIEIVNLRGQIAVDRDNAPLKLESFLKEDMALGRFSMISFDRDVGANERSIRQKIRHGLVIGAINANSPDFEFANFSLEELVEIAARLDESLNANGSSVRAADWNGIVKGRQLAERYVKVTATGRTDLKGMKWGQALAIYAVEHPIDPRTGEERPVIRATGRAVWAWNSDYDFHRKHHRIEAETFEQHYIPNAGEDLGKR